MPITFTMRRTAVITINTVITIEITTADRTLHLHFCFTADRGGALVEILSDAVGQPGSGTFMQSLLTVVAGLIVEKLASWNCSSLSGLTCGSSGNRCIFIAVFFLATYSLSAYIRIIIKY